jgi:nicotinate-nucleotide adenylyltransferase
MKTGIMGGTFNPVHNGHIYMMQKAAEALDLDHVMLIPSGSPPHKPDDVLIPATERYEMCLLAASEYDNIVVSSIEIEREGTTYTTDTLEQLEHEFGKSQKFFFIIGGDTVFLLETWKDYEKVFKKCDFAVFGRQGLETWRVLDKIDFLNQKYGARLHFIPDIPPDISSSEIRKKIHAGEDFSQLVPKRIKDYINRHGIYR